MALATLTIDLKASLARLEDGMGKAVRLAEKDAARMERAFGAAKAVAGGVGGALLAGLSVTAVTSFISSTNDALLAIKDLAEGTGSSVEQISALENALRANNRTLAEAQPVLSKFASALKEADGKNGISQALERIGLDAKELRKQDIVVSLQQVGKALQGYTDDLQKNNLVKELFGKSTEEVIPLLNDLADSQLKATDGIRQATEEADKFEKNLARLQVSVGNLGRDMAGPLVTALNNVFDAFNQKLQGGSLADRLFGAYETDFVRARIEDLKRQIGKGIPGLEKELDLYLGKLDAKLYAGGSRRPANEGGGGLGSLRSVGELPGAAGGGGRAGRTPRAAAEEKAPSLFVGPEVPESLTAALKAIEQTDVAKVQALQEQLNQLLSIESAGGSNPALAEALAKTRAQLEEMDPAAKLAKEQTERLLEILAQTPGGGLKSVLQDIDLINEAFRTGKIDVEQWAQAVTQASAPLRKAGEDTKQTDTFAKDLGLSFSSAAEDAIVFGKSASEVLKGLEQDIIRIITRKLLTEPLANGVSGFLGGLGGGGGGGGIGSILGSFFGGFFADGGYLPPGKWGIAGERGPEPIYGGRTGMTIQPNGGGGGNVSMTNNFYLSGPVTRDTQAQVAAQAARAVERANRRNN